MKKSILIITILFCFSACKKENKATVIKEKSFHIGFHYTPSFSGIFTDSKTLEEFVYFGEPVTKKELKIFHLNGKILEVISLKKINAILGDIDKIEVLSKDTIVAISKYTGVLVAFDSKGEPRTTVDVNKIGKEKNGNFFEYHTLGASVFTDKNSVFLKCDWRYNSADKLNNKEPKDNLEYLRYYENNSFKSPFFLKITNFFSTKPTVSFECYNLDNNFTEKPVFTLFSQYQCDNGFVFVSDFGSGNILCLDSKKLTISKKINIESNYTTIGFKHSEINKETYNKVQEIVNASCLKGHFSKLWYNLKEKKYYVMVHHEIIGKIKADNPFSIITYDTNFENPKEYPFLDRNYRGGYSIMTKEGLMMSKKIKNGKETFVLFNFN